MATKKAEKVNPFAISDSIKAAEMPLFHEITAWLCLDYQYDRDKAQLLVKEAHGKEAVIEPYLWKAKSQMLIERSLFAAFDESRATHWMNGIGAVSFLSQVHNDLDQRGIGLPGRREIVNKALAVTDTPFEYERSGSDAREAFNVYADETLPPNPTKLKKTEEAEPQSELDEAFPREKPKRKLVNPDHWYYNAPQRNGFYNLITMIGFEKHNIEPHRKSRYIHDALGVKRLYETKLSPEEAAKKVLEYIEFQEGKQAMSDQHWIKDDKQRTEFWKRANTLCNKHKVTTKGAERKQVIHDILGVEHTDEYGGTPDEAIKELEIGLDELFPLDDQPASDEPKQDDKKSDPTPDDVVKQLWTELLPQVKELRPDVTDKTQAMDLVYEVLGYKTMLAAYTELGSNGVRELWAKNKHELIVKPPVVNDEPKTSKPASNGSKPNLPPVDQNTSEAPPEINLPPVDQNRQLALVSTPSLLPTTGEWQFMREMAQAAIKSGLMPKGIKTPEAALLVIETGRELGIPPTLALRKIQIIQGQPTLAAELMLALVKRSGLLEYISIEGDDTQCVVTMRRKGESSYVETFTMTMARKMMTTEYEDGQPKRIPLADKFNWKTMPATMLKWRAVSACCRTVFPDITMGIYTSEEMNDNIVMSGRAEDYVEGDIAA